MIGLAGEVLRGRESGARGDRRRPVSAPDVTEQRRLEVWRQVYRRSAYAPDWPSVHRWWYDQGVARNTTDDIRDKLLLARGQSILDVGCASGAALASLVPPAGRGFGVDHCEAVLQRGSDFGVNADTISLVNADASRLPLMSSSFDRVIGYSVFQCFPSTIYAIRVLREMHRVCKPGGLIFIGDVFGELERMHRLLRGMGVGVALAELLLVPFQPFRLARIPWLHSGQTLIRRTYTRRFFQMICARLGGQIEFLEQAIPARSVLSKTRFDVRIRKSG